MTPTPSRPDGLTKELQVEFASECPDGVLLCARFYSGAQVKVCLELSCATAHLQHLGVAPEALSVALNSQPYAGISLLLVM